MANGDGDNIGNGANDRTGALPSGNPPNNDAPNDGPDQQIPGFLKDLLDAFKMHGDTFQRYWFLTITIFGLWALAPKGNQGKVIAIGIFNFDKETYLGLMSIFILLIYIPLSSSYLQLSDCLKVFRKYLDSPNARNFRLFARDSETENRHSLRLRSIALNSRLLLKANPQTIYPLNDFQRNDWTLNNSNEICCITCLILSSWRIIQWFFIFFAIVSFPIIASVIFIVEYLNSKYNSNDMIYLIHIGYNSIIYAAISLYGFVVGKKDLEFPLGINGTHDFYIAAWMLMVIMVSVPFLVMLKVWWRWLPQIRGWRSD